MEFPQELRAGLEQLLDGEDISKLTAAAEGLSMRYRNDSGHGKSLVSGKRDILAYAAVRMPATFGAVGRALELGLAQTETEICSILDVGAGTGAASHAAQLLTDCESITCIEREQSMIDVGKKLMECRGISPQWIKRDISQGIGIRADLVLCSYCLNEMMPAARKAALRELWAAAEKLLVIVEPGTPEGFAQIKEARDILTELGGHIAAPCPISGACPLPEGDWCHFTARVSRTKLHKQLKGGDAPYEDEKFCFLAVSREPPAPCKARVLRHPKIESGRVTLRLCTADGISEKMYTRKSTLFKAARKAAVGDEFAAERQTQSPEV